MVQLIRSVLASMHIYWASVFILPTDLMLELKQLMRGFLWCQGEMKKGRAKVAWESWPDVWMSKYYDLGTIGVPHLSDASDKLVWKYLSNVDVGFSVATVWECLGSFEAAYGYSQNPIWFGCYCGFCSPMAKMRYAFYEEEAITRSGYRCHQFYRSSQASVMQIQEDEAWDGLKEECSPIVVLFFSSPRFFPLGFSWEGFLRRQGRLAVYTPMLLQRNAFVALCYLGPVSSDMCGCSSKLLEVNVVLQPHSIVLK
ncbi:hypothetical protein Tco_1085177 [Tanacetum coccineum]